VPAAIGIIAVGLLGMSIAVGKGAHAMPAVLLYSLVLLGQPFAMTPMQTNSLSGLPKEYYAHGTAIMNTVQMIAASLGSSLFVGIMSARQSAALAAGADQRGALVAGLSLAFLAAAGVAAASLVAALFVRGAERPEIR
jgi:DHA2 family lincomycin resistance protein-like MFS transporter